MTAETESLLARIAELTDRLDLLEERESRRGNNQEPHTVSRRGMLRYAAVGAGAAIAGSVVATTHPAAADTGDNFVLGVTNDADATTFLLGSGITDAVLNVDTGGQATTVAIDAYSLDSPAISGTAQTTGSGLQGTSSAGIGVVGISTTGAGVRGTSDSSSGVIAESVTYVGLTVSTTSGPVAILATNQTGDGTTAVIRATHDGSGSVIEATSSAGNAVTATADAGVAVQAESATGVGVSGTSGSAIGVTGTSGSNVGVLGTTTTGKAGVEGVSTTSSVGVYGSSSGTGTALFGRGFGTGRAVAGYISNVSSASACIYGNTLGTGAGVEGKSLNGRGAQFTGKLAQVRLVPGALSTRPNGGARGDLYCDAGGRLWFCKGSVGWVQIG